MKKLITVLMMSLAIMGCEESGGTAASATKAPAVTAPIADEPVVDPAPVYKTVTIQLNTSEPTQYQIRIERLSDDVNFVFDTANPVLINGTTSQQISELTLSLEYRCRIYLFKNTATAISSGTLSVDSDIVSTFNFGSGFSNQLTYLTNPAFFN